MGTRSVIQVEGVNFVQVYKHWDGYPSAMLPWLKDFNETFTKNRGDDPTYKFAQLLRSSAFDCSKFDLGSDRETGWGVVEFGCDAGQDYTYVLKKDGTVTVSPESEE